MLTYKIATEFTDVPGPRFKRLGKFSGEEFLEVLIGLLSKNEKIQLVLDGVEGYPSSFLEESFGGLIRHGISLSEVVRRVEIVAEDPAFKFYVEEIREYILEADRAEDPVV